MLFEYAVASHVDYVAPRRKLLDSLRAIGVPNNAVVVYLAGADSRAVFEEDGVAHRQITDNSFEYTPLIESVIDGHPKHGQFLLHDTCEVYGDFLAQSSSCTANDGHVSVDVSGWTNMGYFSADFLWDVRKLLLTMRNCSKERAQLGERIFTRLGAWRSFSSKPYETRGESDVYGQGVSRRQIYFDGIHLVKYMANYAGVRDRVKRP